MNKSDFVKCLSAKSGLTIKDSAAFLEAFLEVTTEALKSGEDITLIGFGSFKVASRNARTARDFKTQKPVNVPPSKTVKFKVGKSLKDAVNS